MMFFNNMFGNMQQPQQSAPVMGAQGSPFAMQQPMQPQMQQPLMMMSGGQMSQAPQQMQDMLNQPGGISFPSRWGER